MTRFKRELRFALRKRRPLAVGYYYNKNVLIDYLNQKEVLHFDVTMSPAVDVAQKLDKDQSKEPLFSPVHCRS